MREARRIAFCFHHSQPSGASIWLLRFLMKSGLSSGNALPILPNNSPMEKELANAGFNPVTIDLIESSLSDGGTRAAAIMANRFRGFLAYRRIFSRQSIGLVYANSSVNLLPIIAAKSLDIPVAIHIHETASWSRTGAMKRRLIKRLGDGIIFCAHCVSDIYAPLPARIRSIISLNGVDGMISEAWKQRDEIRSRNGVAPEEKVFLFLGNISPLKGVHDLLAAWPSLHKRHPESRLMIAGRHDPANTHPRITRFLEEGLEGAEYLGFRSDVPDLLAMADFFVLPSYFEAMPLTVVESMMVGTPVIAREVGDCKLLLADKRGWSYPESGPRALYKVMRRALTSNEASERAARAQLFASGELTLEKQVVEILRFLDDF